MQIVDTRTNLDEEIECRILAQKLLLTNKVKQVTFGSIFECQIYGGFILKTGIKPTDILVIELFLDPNFSYECFLDFTG